MLAWQSIGVFSSMTMWGSVSPGRVVDGDTPERVSIGEMTVDYLTVFGATPSLGRPFNADDMTSNAPPVLLLSNAYWRSHFGGANSGVIGRSIRFDDGTATIVGVLPCGLRVRHADVAADTVPAHSCRSAGPAASSPPAARMASRARRPNAG